MNDNVKGISPTDPDPIAPSEPQKPAEPVRASTPTTTTPTTAPVSTQAPYVPVYIPPVPTEEEFKKLHPPVVAPKSNMNASELYGGKTQGDFEPYNKYLANEKPTSTKPDSLVIKSNLKPNSNLAYVPNGLGGMTYES